MALVLNAEAGSASANSYVTVADAVTYFEARLHSSIWDDSTEEIQTAALVMSTRILDTEFLWRGSPKTKTQALRWPRTGLVTPDLAVIESTTIPIFLKEATAELAMWLIDSDRLEEPGTLGFYQIKVGPIFATVNPHDRRDIIPEIVKSLVSFYGEVRDSALRVLERV